MSQDVVGTLSIANMRLYQYAMAEQPASRATVQRRLVSLNRFGLSSIVPKSPPSIV